VLQFVSQVQQVAIYSYSRHLSSSSSASSSSRQQQQLIMPREYLCIVHLENVCSTMMYTTVALYVDNAVISCLQDKNINEITYTMM
jgi:hypothetical protein